MGRLTTHVLDTARGRPGAGITLELYEFGDERRFLATTTTGEDGRCPRPLLEGDAMVKGVYELVFHAGDYFRDAGIELTDPPFLDRVVIRFGIASHEPREVGALDPNLTVLNYLREIEGRTGTKEGCAEGDCGACTVVLGELAGDRIRYRAVNACILFTPQLDGRQLITVEHLRRPDGSLHPVQQAMVESHGSQCGFCTPGFVMSLFALYHSEQGPSRQTILDSLAGNLCRCTGYRP